MNPPTNTIDETDDRTPYHVATDYLTNPKAKLSSRMRRKFQTTRAKTSPYASAEKKDWQEKLSKKLAEISIHRLVRRMKSYARQSATCVHLLRRMDPESNFAVPIKKRGIFWAICFQLANSERLARAQKCIIPKRSSLPLKVQKRLAP